MPLSEPSIEGRRYDEGRCAQHDEGCAKLEDVRTRWRQEQVRAGGGGQAG